MLLNFEVGFFFSIRSRGRQNLDKKLKLSYLDSEEKTMFFCFENAKLLNMNGFSGTDINNEIAEKKFFSV